MQIKKALIRQFLISEGLACFAIAFLMWINWSRTGGFVAVTFLKILLVVQIAVGFGMLLSWFNLKAQNNEL